MDQKEQFSPHSHIPYGEAGTGFYTDNTLGCYNVIQEATPLVLESIKNTNIKGGSVFTIADYGTADGGTSMPIIYACVKAIREKYGEELAINVIYEDQPVNDFKSLFMRVHGHIPGPPSFLLDFPNVYVTASGTDFYSQCFPKNTVTLGFSATAMHWLRKKPCSITGALHHTMITIPEEGEKFREQAAKDWEQVLLKRADELMPGCQMVLVQFAVDEKGQFLGNTDGNKVSMHHLMRDLWKGFVSEGKITEEEFHHTTFVNYYRTLEEFKKPFETDSPVTKAGLKLVSMETRVVRCPYKQRWMTEKGDPKEHAKRYVPTTRTWSNSTFLSGLSDSRSPEEKAKIVDEFFQRYEDEVAKHPEDHGMDYVHAYIVVKKE
ncbi:probable S-adenosylmethionine-dependent methyltransferase At5g38780 isoform X2 [Actinia tenebrosa]|nr:probable S-adenosylmethionine-dependent methyltransferase At5g38780 isoform X2 [Actinia tenebrosa]